MAKTTTTARKPRQTKAEKAEALAAAAKAEVRHQAAVKAHATRRANAAAAAK